MEPDTASAIASRENIDFSIHGLRVEPDEEDNGEESRERFSIHGLRVEPDLQEAHRGGR